MSALLKRTSQKCLVEMQVPLENKLLDIYKLLEGRYNN